MTKNKAKILVSGVKPTGRLHIGNYFGAIKQFVDLQDKYTSYFFIADLHALTSTQNRETLSEDIVNVAIDYLAVGLDPEKSVLFKQSGVSAHPELTWIFNCITTVPYLMRAHAYKDAKGKDREINVGVFDYPLLMAADILMYDANVVPVGLDQKQHVEITRDTAEKFNRIFGETFTIPEPLIIDSVGTIPGTDGRKMSKSYGNTIDLFAEKKEISKAVMSIPTDSKGVTDPKNPDESTLFQLHKLFGSESETESLRNRYSLGKIGYKESKEILIEQIENFIKPLREKRASISTDRGKIIEIINTGTEAAKIAAEKKMKEVREKVGFTLKV